MNLDFYWKNIDSKLENLMQYGMVKLPSLEMLDLNIISKDISLEMGNQTFKELGRSHEKFLTMLGINEYLSPKLLNLAKKFFDYKGDLKNQYHIARKVTPGNSREMFRAHFDSHLFTMVIPIKIPTIYDDEKIGELIYFQK